LGASLPQLNARANTGNLVTFTNMTPASNGILTITVAPATANTVNDGVINAFTMTEHGATGMAARTGEDFGTASLAEGVDAKEEYASVYPNPAEDEITIEINSPITGAQVFSLSFRDARGMQVFSHQLEAKGETMHIRASGLRRISCSRDFTF